MKKKIPLWGALAACVLCVLAGGLLVIGALRLTLGAEGIALLQTKALIQTRFVGDYDPEEVHQATETAMVNALGDRWSYYLTPQQLRQTTDTRNNSYVGIGLTVENVEEGLLITVVNPDGPAQKAGVLPGEIITAVDGTPVTPGNQVDSIDAIRGESGTPVVLELLDETGARREVTVTRGAVRVVSVRWEMLEDDVALLTIANFYTGAADQVERCLKELREAGARALVIDVRNDPGGYVTELTDILDQLLPEGDIFRITSFTGGEKVYTSGPSCVDLPMAVLVNENSYSAAELLAAQIHETTGAPLVGTRTTGKGYSQNLYRLRDGGAVNLSSARYYTGGGTSLIGTGLVPDPYVGLNYYRQWDLLMGKLDHTQDGQLQAALKALDLEEM